MPVDLKIFQSPASVAFLSCTLNALKGPALILAKYPYAHRIRRKGREMYFDQVEFGKRIKELRRRKHLTQMQLSERLDISIDHIKRIECGERACSLDILILFAEYFDVSTDYLLTGKDHQWMQIRERIKTIAGNLSELADSEV